jgi:hypothetical protein
MPKVKSKRRAESDKRIAIALLKHEQYPNFSLREIARQYGCHHTTLTRRLNGGKTTAESREPVQHLSIAQEKALVDWITRLQRHGHPSRRSHIRQLAQEVLNTHHQNSNLAAPPTITDTWVQRFLYRHSELRVVKGRTMERARAKEVTKSAMSEWFEQLESVIDEFDILPENMYNVDETGFSIGTIKSAHVVVNKAEQFQSVIHPGRQEWATIIECISGDGTVVSPFIILKGKNVLQSWIPTSILNEEWKIAANESGWTNNDLGYLWLTEVFEPNTREKAAGRKRLLICDGHESHVSARFVSFCIQHDIELVLLVPHSSHLTQPLDVGVFGPLKQAVSREMDRLLRSGIVRLEKAE